MRNQKLEIYMDMDYLRRRLGLVPNGSGGASLALPRQRLERAEAELEAARAAMRSAADVAGIKRSGLFSGSAFVSRGTADDWYEAGLKEGRREVTDALMEMRGLDPKVGRARRKTESEERRVLLKAETARWRSTMREAGFFDAVAEGDYRKAAAIYGAVHSEEKHSSKGAAILAAGARARMSGDNERPLPEKGSFADLVIAAGRKRRGEDQ
jgi:hypothetical protein